jgi:putative two-component system response regulator
MLDSLVSFVAARERSSQRLIDLCLRFGAELSLSQVDVHALRLAGQLHDLSDVALPASLVLKRSILDPDERELVRRHTDIVAALLEPLPNARLLLSIIRHHHERWDGSGYPGQLAGEAIPPLARTFRILDIMDTLLGGRSLRPAHSPAATLAILRRERENGGLDPALTTRFERWIADEGRSLLPA